MDKVKIYKAWVNGELEWRIYGNTELLFTLKNKNIEMKTETLISKLKEKGYTFPTCLQWKAEDIDARLRAIGQADQIKVMSNIDKLMILDEFFDEFEDDICEFINLKLEDHLDTLTHYNVSSQPF